MTRPSGRVGTKKKRRRGRHAIGPGANSTSIPIPSFSTSDSSPAKSSSDKPPAKPFRDKSCLLRTEGALEVQLLSQSRQKKSHGGRKLLALDDFYALARRLDLTETSKQEDSLKQTATNSVSLNKEEQLLHDLLCVGSPTLYKLVRASSDDSSVQIQNGSKKESVWCLEVVPFAGNRMEELRRLTEKQQVNDSSSKSILSMIRSHKTSLQQSQPEVEDKSSETADKDKNLMLEPNIRPDMNLEERVRARAEARQNRQLASKQASDGADTIDRAALVRLADALWSHSRHIMLRQSQLELSRLRNGIKTDSKKERSCVMTLKDVVQTFSGSLVVRKSPGKSISLHATKKEKASQRQVIQALQELEHLIPGWITMVDPQNGKDKQGRVSKHATVWIKPIEYQSARLRLAGKTKNKTAPVCKPPIGKRASPETTTRAPAQAQSDPQGAQVQETQASVETTPQHRVPRVSLTPTKDGQIQSQEPPIAQPAESLPPATKKARTLASPLKLAPALYNPTKSRPLAGTKRPAQEAPLNETTPKKRRGLRVNQNLILTDADYAGGEIIEPTGASPRGLKMLFSKLKQGKRI